MKKLLKKLAPERFILLYHAFLAAFASFYYGFPAKKMIIIGVTGTKGKTSTINFIWSALMAGGIKTGIISTANIRIGDKESMNQYHMTMPGRFKIQRLLAQMFQENCKICLVETTSEGIKQYRHIGMYYDIGVFTNLFPEHLTAHGGSFEKYREMKGKMFQALTKHSKKIAGNKIKKLILVNKDSKDADYFLKFPANLKLSFALHENADFMPEKIQDSNEGVRFKLGSSSFQLGVLGSFNIYNALPAILIARHLGVSDELIAKGLLQLKVIPGRMELLEEAQNFTVIVDYAHEKESMTKVLEAAQNMRLNNSKIIILLGAEGGGRDKAKRPIMGELAAKMADFVIVSNVDPYEDDPTEIAEEIATASEKFGKIRGQDLFVIEDRRNGIQKALSLAKKGDIVLITGKGAEQSIVIDGKKHLWDDRDVVREELQKLATSTPTHIQTEPLPQGSGR